MAANKLIPYWITVREFDEPDKPWDQTNLQSNAPEFPRNNLADFFEDFLLEFIGEEDVHVNEKHEKTFTVESPIRREGNTIEGRFKSGEWGRNADFWDIEEHERIEDARKENHAEEVPYYFMFHIPDEDRRQAILILSKYKRKGIKTLFRDMFLPRARDIDTGDAYMDIEPHYSDKVLEKINEADSIASVKFRGKETIPAREEYAQRNHIERVNEDISGQIDVGTEFKMTPTGNNSAFRELVRGLLPDRDGANFDYGRIEEQDFDSASVTVVEGESELTFSLWEEEIPMRMDISPEEYDLDIYGGYPTPYSLGCVARQLANDLLRDYNTDLETESLIPRTVGMPEDEGTGSQP